MFVRGADLVLPRHESPSNIDMLPPSPVKHLSSPPRPPARRLHSKNTSKTVLQNSDLSSFRASWISSVAKSKANIPTPNPLPFKAGKNIIRLYVLFSSELILACSFPIHGSCSSQTESPRDPKATQSPRLCHEVEQNSQSESATFIAFEALGSKGTEHVQQIMTRVKQLDIVRRISFSEDYCQLTACTWEYPVVRGISTAGTSSLYATQGSSGLKYDYPYVSKSHKVVDTVSSYVQKYITPVVGIVKHFTGTARYRSLVISDF